MALRLFSRRLWLSLCLAGSLFVSYGEALAAPKLKPEVTDARQALQAGEDFERTRRWIDAIEHYEASIKKWPDDRELSYGLRRSKIHFGIERRYSDNSFRTNMLMLSRHDSLSLFDEVINKIKSHFVDPLSSTSFVAHGTESLYIALANERFLDHHLPGRRASLQNNIAKFRDTLRTQYWNKPLNSGHAAHQVVSDVAGLAESQLGLNSTAVVLEYVFGGCHALDDYSNCLTPDRLSDLYDNIDGEFVGLGIEMKAEAGKGMSLVNVLPDSPASEAGLMIGDYIVGIDGHDCRNMSTDEAAGRLKGKPGSRGQGRRSRASRRKASLPPWAVSRCATTFAARAPISEMLWGSARLNWECATPPVLRGKSLFPIPQHPKKFYTHQRSARNWTKSGTSQPMFQRKRTKSSAHSQPSAFLNCTSTPMEGHRWPASMLCK